MLEMALELDSNPGPSDYKAPTLTTLLYGFSYGTKILPLNFPLSILLLYFDCFVKFLDRDWACFQDGQLLIPFIQVPFCLPSSCSNEDIVSGVQSMIDSQMDTKYGYFVFDFKFKYVLYLDQQTGATDAI